MRFWCSGPANRAHAILAAVCLAAVIGWYSLAAESLVPPSERQRILARIDSLHVSRQVDSAQVYIAPYLAAAKAAGDSVFLMPLTSKLGRLWTAFGHPQRGEPLLRDAASMAEIFGDSLAWCDALRWLGVSVEQQGRLDEAATIYHRLLALAQIRGDLRHETWARVGLAYGAGRKGKFEAAIADYERAIELFRAQADGPGEVWTLNNLGSALMNSGHFVPAAEVYGRAADLARQIGYPTVEAMAQNNKAVLEFTLGDPGVAMNHFRRVMGLQRDLQQLQQAVLAGTNVALCLSHLGRLDEAVALLDSLRQECETNNFVGRRAFVLNTLAGVRQLQGRRHEAVRIYRRILADPHTEIAFNDRLGSVLGLAHALAEMDSSTAALTLLQDEEKRRAGQWQHTTRIAFELALGDRLRETGQVAAALAKYEFVVDTTAASGLRQDHVVALAGAARCRRELGDTTAALASLREAAQVWRDNRDVPLDPEWREQRGVSGRLVYTQLAALILADDADGGSAEQAFDAVQTFKARTLAERIGDVGGAPVGPDLTVDHLQNQILNDDEVFLDAYLGPAESILFAVTTRECRAVVLADAPTLVGRLQRYHELLATPPTSAHARTVAAAAGRRLGQELLGPLAFLLVGNHHVIYAPDGALNLVPLVAMGLANDNLTWSRVPSATIFSHLRANRDQERAAGHGVLAAAASETPEGERLPGAVREVRHLARTYRDVELRLTGGSAETLVASDLAPFNILHLATHARVDDQHPWAAEIILDARSPTGKLRARRIVALDLSARLAVLSACETGSGRILSAEGVLGLSSAFLGAGVPAVVASLWPVADGVTADLMEAFYNGLAAGYGPAAALAAAQNEMRRNAATAHPFYWAGFVVIGDGAIAVDLETRSRFGRLGGIFMVALVAGLGLLVVRRRRRRRK